MLSICLAPAKINLYTDKKVLKKTYCPAIIKTILNESTVCTTAEALLRSGLGIYNPSLWINVNGSYRKKNLD
jgi:hypothetical protein